MQFSLYSSSVTTETGRVTKGLPSSQSVREKEKGWVVGEKGITGILLKSFPRLRNVEWGIHMRKKMTTKRAEPQGPVISAEIKNYDLQVRAFGSIVLL